MIIRETYNITLNVNATCAAGKRLIKASEGYKPDEVMPVKLIIGTKATEGQRHVYLEKEANDAKVGSITSLTDKDGNQLDNDDITAIASGVNYQIVFIGPQQKTMTGVLQLLVDETSATTKTDSELQGDIQKEVSRIVKEGISTQENMDDVLQYMRDNYIDDFLQVRTLKKYRKYNKPVRRPKTMYVDPHLEERHAKREEGMIAEGLRNAVSRYGTICEGDKSVGKNVYLDTLAWLGGMPEYLVTFSRQMTPSSVYGDKTTDPTAAKELAIFEESTFVKAAEIEEKRKILLNACVKQGLDASTAIEVANNAMSDDDRKVMAEMARFRKLQAQSASVNIVIDASELYDWLVDGGLMIFNEMNMADANFLASFTNQLLDGTGFIFIPGRGEVGINKDCVLCATQNADYQGTEQQNEATMSRFECLHFKQPESIKALLQEAVRSSLKQQGFEGTALDGKYYNDVERFYKQCRGAVRKGQVSNACLNIRGFVRALTKVAEAGPTAMTTLRRSITNSVINTCPLSERQALIDILASTCTL